MKEGDTMPQEKYVIMRKGKTTRDHKNGSWSRHIANKIEKAHENRGKK